MQVPPNPKDKNRIEPPKPPGQIARVGGMLVFDKAMPSVLIPAWVRLRPVIRDNERWVIINAIGPTVFFTVIAWVVSVTLAQWFEWNPIVPSEFSFGIMILAFVLSVVHYVLAIDDAKPEPPPAKTAQADNEGDDTSEIEPVGDIAGWMSREETDGGAVLRFYKPPRTANGRYVRVPLVQRMAIEIVNAGGWVSERDMARLGVPNAPYRLLRQNWLDRRWITALPDKTTRIEAAGRVMIGKIASTAPL